MYCPTCGRETRGPRYCTSCGAPLDQAPPLSTEQLREARPEKPARPWRGWAARLARNRVVWAAIAVCAVLLVAFVVWRGRKRDLTLVTEPLMPGFYGALEAATGVRPEKGVRFIGEDGSFYVLQFASQAEAMSAWEKIVSSAGAEKEIGQLEGYVEGAAWLVGDGESELVRLQDDTVIVVPMETSQEADAKTILSSILEPVDSEDIRSGLEGAPLYEPTVSPTLYVRASGTPTPRPTVRTATPTPRRPTAQPTPTSALVYEPRCPYVQASLTRVEVDVAASEVRFEGTAAAPEGEFDYWKLEWWPAGSGDEAADIVDRALHRTPVTEGSLAEWDISEVPAGDYHVRLRVVRKDGNYEECVTTIERPEETAALPMASRTTLPSPTPSPAPPTLTPTPAIYLIYLPEVMKVR